MIKSLFETYGGRANISRASPHRNGIRIRIVDESTTIIPAREFYQAQSVIEVICQGGIVKIETLAFYSCTLVKRIEIKGVEEIEPLAFCDCEAVTHVECPKLKIVGEEAFLGCGSLNSIDLTSVKIVDVHGFTDCLSMKEAKFGWDLELIREGAFMGCLSLERITIPLIDGVISHDDIFMGCKNLKHVDLVEGNYLRKSIPFLLLEEWSDDLTQEMDSIQQILPQTSAGDYNNGVVGEKAQVIRIWIRRFLDKLPTMMPSIPGHQT